MFLATDNPTELEPLMDQVGIKLVRDAVHGDLEFNALECGIINTPQYQRLRGICHLGLGHLVYPSAQLPCHVYLSPQKSGRFLAIVARVR
jgi:hypothetical protein